jgi:frataxin-like iron-binding protein CyaY
MLLLEYCEMTEEMIEDMEESVMNADQNVALDIHVERSDRTVTVDQEVDINSTKSLSCRSIWVLIP